MTISLCMIVRDVEDALGPCLESVEKYVDEIILVDTGSQDRTKDVGLAHGAKIFDFTPATNPDAFIIDDETTGAPPPYTGQHILADFSGARNLSFQKATKDYVMWLDSDDIVVGADKLPWVVHELTTMQDGVAWFRYDYSFDANGKSICQLWRERILPRGAGKWVNAIHEVVTLTPTTRSRYFDEVVIRHRRETLRPRPLVNRNYKVLRRVYEQEKAANKVDPRTLFYLGNETKFIDPDQSVRYFDEYVQLSGWAEERGVARILMGQILEQQGKREEAFKAYSSASIDSPGNPDSLFAMARLAYKKDDWAECIRLTEMGFALGNPVSPIMYNPLDRTYYPHGYYNVALNKVGRVADAARSCEEALLVNPEDSNLLYNKKLYDKWLADHPQPRTPRPQKKSISFEKGALDGVPELPKELTETFVIQIWKEFLRHDEIVKAKSFLESLPYFLDDSGPIADAKKKTEELLGKVSSNESLKAYYAGHAVGEALPVDVEIPTSWSQYPRWHFVRRFLEGKRGLRVLDLGCQDGWISNRVAALGHSVVGLDFSDSHLEIARKNAERFRLDATFINGFIDQAVALLEEQFDVVICTEVIEHVVEPDKLLRNLRDLLRPKGTLLLSTPRGAWLQGYHGVTFGPGVPAPRWDEPREHIRAYSLSGLRKELEKHFHVKSCYGQPVPTPDVPNQSNLYAVCTNVWPVFPNKGKDIVIWTGPAWEWWGPISPYYEGTGGSELAAIEMAKHLAKLGHNVTVYCDCPLQDGIVDGANFRHYGEMPAEVVCDVFISSRQPQVVLQRKIEAKAKFLWVHDIHVGGNGPETHSALLEFDRILCLSKWHKDFFCKQYPWLAPERVVVTRNGINLERFPYPDRAKGNRLIYTSSGNRGLVELLELFPKIQEQVPDVQLDVFYGFNVWRKAAAGNPQELAYIDQLEHQVTSKPGVTFHGRANQQTLAAAWLKAKVWAYPTSFTETSCISAMEAQAAGAVPVTTDLAALGETVGGGILLEAPVDDVYKKQFVALVVALLKDEKMRMAHVLEGRAYAETLSWEALANDWVTMFEDVIEDVKVNPMHRFLDTP